MRPRIFLIGMGALGLLTFGAEVRAEDDGSNTDEVVVRGRRGGGFVSEARLDDAPREVTDAASLVAPLPGVHVRRLGADDSFATLSVRGTSSTQVSVYVAGVPLSGGADPTLDLATLPLWPGANARVYRSFAPAALGPGSLGGTLVLDPPSPRAAPRTDVWAAAGSFGSRRLRIGDLRGDPDGFRIATGVSASRSDDDFSYLDPLATAARGSDVVATRTNAGHAAAAGLASFALPIDFGTRKGALTSTTLAQVRRQELPGTITSPTPSARLDSTRLVSALELRFPIDRGTLGVRTWGRREGLAITDSKEDAARTLGPTHTDDTILALGTSIGVRGRPSRGTEIEARVDVAAERFAPGTWIGALPPPGASRKTAGVALDTSTRFAEIALVSASGRLDTWSDQSDGGTSSTEARPTGHLGVELEAGPVTIASHGGVLARPPSFVERFGNRGAFLGSPTLTPESATTIDLGARFAHRFGKLRLELESAGFATFASDLIVFVYQGADGRSKATNIGKAHLYGLESQARTRFYRADVRISHTAIATVNEATFGAPPLPGRPEHDVVFDAAYTVGPVRLRYGLDVVTGIRADLTGRIVVPDRALHSAGARVEIPYAPGLSIALDVRNLFDLRVVEYPGAIGPVRAPASDLYQYPLPGRSFLVSARWTTERVGNHRD